MSLKAHDGVELLAASVTREHLLASVHVLVVGHAARLRTTLYYIEYWYLPRTPNKVSFLGSRTREK